MKESLKTGIFLAVTGVLLLSSVAVYFATRPSPDEDFALIGEEFYPDFQDAQVATFLEVDAFDEKKGEPISFRVEKIDNVWRIPTHYNYPAEAAERLAKTATSVIGIRRQALAGRRKQQHQRFGVLDPMDESLEDGEGVGKRLTLGDGENVLADFIIGNQVPRNELALLREQQRNPDAADEAVPTYYVRRPDEVETFLATLEIDLSTRFADWIQPDLLKIETGDVRELLIENYSIEYKEKEIRQGPLVMISSIPEKIPGETQKLFKESEFGPWKLEGINSDEEELETSKISTLASTLNEMEIKGVRPRYRFRGQQLLTPELELNIPKSVRTQGELNEIINEFVDDLDEKGFQIDLKPAGEKVKAELMSDKGELKVGTSDGLVYNLYFGKIFSGSTEEIEIGGTAAATGKETEKTAADESKEKTADKKDASAADGKKSETGAAKDEEEEEKKGRYLLVRVTYDPARVEGEPVEPIKPTEPVKPSPKITQPANATTAAGNSPTGPAQPVTQPPATQPPAQSAPTTQDKAREPKPEATEPEATKPEATKPENAEAPSGENADTKAAEAVPGDGTKDGCEFFQEDEAKSGEKTPQVEADSKQAETEKPKAADTGDESTDQPKSTVTPSAETPTAEDASAVKTDENEADSLPVNAAMENPQPPIADPLGEYERELEEFRQAMQQYAIDVEQYQDNLKSYADKLKASEQKAVELSDRFGAWFYVISPENLENLRLGHADLVKKKTADPAAGPGSPLDGLEGLQFPFPGNE
jgi:hypothetical protein